MDAVAGPLTELFFPLRFAVRDGFAGAANLRDLRRVVEHHAPKALAAGADPAGVEALAAAAAAFDAAPPGGREAAVRRVLEVLGRLVALPPDLAAAAGGVPAGTRRGPQVPPGVEVVEPFAADLPDAWQPFATSAPPREQSFRLEPPAAQQQAKPKPKRAAPPTAKPKARKAAQPRAAAPAEEPESSTPARITLPAYARGRLDLPLADYPGVGPRTAQLLAKKGIGSVGHLLFALPRGYQDRRGLATIRDLVPGQKGLTFGEVVEATEVFNPRQRRKMLRVVLRDETSRLALTFFHYWPSMLKRFERGKRFFVWGEVKLFGGFKQIVHPELEESDELDSEGASLNMNRIVPAYRGMDEVGQGRYRALVHRALAAHLRDVPEVLPAALREKRGLVPVQEALASVHFPGNEADAAALAAGASPGHRRLAYEELLLISIGLALKARGVQVEPGHVFDVSQQQIDRAIGMLPFTPTGAQVRAIAAIAEDMGQPAPMNRLIQGDVGSGKTAVALVACLLAVFDGRQAALMAPTEILAEQHHRNFTQLLEGTGIEVALLAAGRGGKALSQAREAIGSGRARIAVGTHALVSEGSLFSELGLVVIDEQHRFGVEQRAELIAKGRRPDVLVMTATPIPRTLALVLHGEMTQTVIDELPPGRTPVKTKVVPSKSREKIYEILDAQLGEGRQAYVVYPLIEESERSDLEDATRGLAVLQERFPGKRLGLLHGRMKADERDEVMAAFRAHAIDLLVATTVVEVGVDVPNASVMVIEHAERFGLSQLHQLRGRVGRGAARSFCFLVDHAGREGRARERLAIMEQTTDGFRIAQADLEIRGPGEFLGTRQAGLPELQFADLSRDARLLEEARADGFELVRADPTLARHKALEAEVFERFAERMSLARVG
ncbi:ATP-dependent DNA helicase RecG [Vulgatibacter sp.]|uniref:ATP-dependent DNA helicase RecG n=1 Tax=Vulgatibacter sp. TaxID=1971226 RepID=UPI0035628027